MTDKILSDYVTEYGFCPFEMIEDRLLDCRAGLRLPENPKTVICCLFPYLLDVDYSSSDISKYAVVPDYHTVVTGILTEVCRRLKAEFPLDEFVPFTDNSPVPEVRAAVYAGLGVRGRNGLLINRTYGSYVFIGEIVTTMDYGAGTEDFAQCLECGKCLKSCPAGSIGENGIDKYTCFSNLNQQKGELSDDVKRLIRETGCAWGCDICQDVCPMNKNIKINPPDEFLHGARLKADAQELFERAYGWRGKKVIERNLNILYEKEG